MEPISILNSRYVWSCHVHIQPYKPDPADFTCRQWTQQPPHHFPLSRFLTGIYHRCPRNDTTSPVDPNTLRDQHQWLDPTGSPISWVVEEGERNGSVVSRISKASFRGYYDEAENEMSVSVLTIGNLTARPSRADPLK